MPSRFQSVVVFCAAFVASVVFASPSFARHVTLNETVKFDDRVFEPGVELLTDDVPFRTLPIPGPAVQDSDDASDWAISAISTGLLAGGHQGEVAQDESSQSAIAIDDLSVDAEPMEIVDDRVAVRGSQPRGNTAQTGRSQIKQHKCPHCDHTASDKRHLRRHVKAQHEGVTHKCPHCDYKTGEKRNLDRHLKAQHDGVTHKCPHCDYAPGYKDSLIRHMKAKHEGVTHKCPHCEYITSYKSDLGRHVNAKHDGLTHKCPQCDYTCSYKRELDAHAKESHGVGIHKCAHCDFITSAKDHLARHVEAKHEGVTHKCPHCDFRAAYKAAVGAHMKTKHGGVTHECPHCEFTSPYTSVLKTHVLAKHDGVRHKCPDCDFTAPYKKDLWMHAKAQHDGVTHKCPQCDFKTAYKTALTKHVQAQHDGVRHKCPHCDYIAAYKHHVGRHVKSKHPGMPVTVPAAAAQMLTVVSETGGSKRGISEVDDGASSSEERPAKRVRLEEERGTPVQPAVAPIEEALPSAEEAAPQAAEGATEALAPTIKIEDTPARVITDTEIRDEIDLLTLDMDPDEYYANCLWLCEAITKFLVTGESGGMSVPTTPAPGSRFREKVKTVKHPIPIKTEDGSVTHHRTVRWQQTTAAIISSDRSKLSGLLPHPTIGFTESAGGLAPVLDLTTKKHHPHHIHVSELDDFISRQIQGVDRPVIGTVTMSRVNEHAEGYTHIVTFYARQNAAGEHVIRYIDPQDRDEPIATTLTETNTFLLHSRQKIDSDTFAPIVDVTILRR